MSNTRVMRQVRSLGLLAFLAGLAFPRGAAADPPSPLHVGQGARSLSENPGGASQETSESEALLSLDELLGRLPEDRPTPSHKRGRRPKVPQARLPDDVPLSPPNAKSRRAIAAGPTEEEIQGGAREVTLLALRDAERVLFPEPVDGLSTNWSFTLPAEEDGGEQVLGLPLRDATSPPESVVSPDDVDWLKSLTMPDLPVRIDRRVVTYLKFYRDNPRGKTIIAIWTRTSGRYVAEMKAQLRRAGLPSDLVWLSMIESGHDPAIASPAGAVGLWQFMPESARMYGLVVDKWVDERRDPARSTQAAVRFLSDLYRRFGNWELAMGAYNMGYAGMSRAVAKFNTNDYWALSRMEGGLPWETTLYVPKIFALAIVMNNRDAFGVGQTKLEPAVAFDTILVEPATPLSDVAAAAGVSKAVISELNPQYLAGRLPPRAQGSVDSPADRSVDRWPMRVPRGRGAQILARLDKRPEARKFATYRTRMGDTIDLIAGDFGLPSSTLETLNSIDVDMALPSGTVLLLPEGAVAKRAGQPPVEVVASRQIQPAPGQRRVFYQVTGQETLEEVADAFSVSTVDLARWNLINQGAHLREGMTIQVLVDDKEPLSEVRVVEESNARVLLAGSPTFHDYHESLKGKRRVRIQVRRGDTLSKIGARYGMTVGSMERVNRISRRTELVEGQQLIVYTDRKVQGSSDLAEAVPLPRLEPPHPELLP